MRRPYGAVLRHQRTPKSYAENHSLLVATSAWNVRRTMINTRAGVNDAKYRFRGAAARPYDNTVIVGPPRPRVRRRTLISTSVRSPGAGGRSSPDATVWLPTNDSVINISRLSFTVVSKTRDLARGQSPRHLSKRDRTSRDNIMTAALRCGFRTDFD